jgi:hypothetical protein
MKMCQDESATGVGPALASGLRYAADGDVGALQTCSGIPMKRIAFRLSSLLLCASAQLTVAVAAQTTSWVYHNGKFVWTWDLSYAAQADYKDTAGLPLVGAFDIALTTQAWGAWQPAISSDCQITVAACFNTTGYKTLIFSAKPTVAKQQFKAAILSSGDAPDGIGLDDLGPYCSGGDNPPIGQWETCAVPLSAFKLTNPIILKFSIGDETGLARNKFYLDEVGFQ